MSSHKAMETFSQQERIVLVVLDFKNQTSDWSATEVLYEMEELIKATGGKVVESTICRVNKPTAGYLLNKLHVEDIAEMCQAREVDTVIFSHELKGSQQRNIEKILELKTIDRTQLILDIFAKHATSKEGKMQVELAQLEYLLPRLTGKGIELSRLGGGIGTLGPGETKLEMDRRRINTRISRLKHDLTEVVTNRQLTRKKRRKKCLPAVSLVGYTNAGKSTLLNALTDAGQKTKDGLFTTLDSLSRQLVLPHHQKIVLSDTVGFMHALPHDLIEAFRATLEEVQEADLLLHVVDVSHPRYRQLYESVLSVLTEIQAGEKRTIVIFNKIDQLDDPGWVDQILSHYDNAVKISAKEKTGIDQLLEMIEKLLAGLSQEIIVNVPLDRMDLVNLAHKEGEVYSIKYYNDRINIRARVPAHLVGVFQKKH